MENDENAAANRRSLLAAYFGRLADTYGGGEYYARRRAAVVAALARELDVARSILDLGCGNGAYLQEFAARCRSAKIVGADLSSEMLSAARRRIGAGARFVRADAGAPPFARESLGLIFCSHVLQFVPDLERCVSEIARCVEPRGVMVATLEGSGIRANLRALMKEKEWERFARVVFAAGRDRGSRRSEQDYRAAFERAELKIELRRAPFTVTWSGMEEWVRLRWEPVVPEPMREEIELLLKHFHSDPRFASLTLDFSDRLLLGRKA